MYTKQENSGAARCEGWARERGYLRQGKEGGAGNSLHIAKATDAAFAQIVRSRVHTEHFVAPQKKKETPTMPCGVIL